MKKHILFLSILSVLLLTACTTHHPNHPGTGAYVPVTPFKIKKMKAVTYQYKSASVGCSEIEFLKKFVGKKVKDEDGVIQVDNILDIHTDTPSSQKSFLGFTGNEVFVCSFWGLAVEYEK